MAFPFVAEALYEFDAQNEGEMSVRVGDTVTVTAEAEGGWYVCTNSSGEQGYVPAGFLEPKAGESAASVAEESVGVGAESDKADKRLSKKRVSRKKLDSDSRAKSTIEKSTKKKDKSKDATGEPKKVKKSKKTSKDDADVTPRAADDSSSASEANPDSARDDVPEPSPRSPSKSKSMSAKGRSASSKNVLSFSSDSATKTDSSSISPRDSISATSRPLPPTAGSPTPQQTTAQSYGTPAPAKSPVFINSSPSSPTMGPKKAPPAIPQKPVSPLGATAKNDSPGSLKRPMGEMANAGPSKVGVPLPPPRGGRLSGGANGPSSSPRFTVRDAASLQAISESASTQNGQSEVGPLSSRSASAISLNPSAGGSPSPTRSLSPSASSRTISVSSDTIGMASSRSMSSIPTMNFEDEKDRRRYYIVGEMLTTERSYVAGLEEGVRTYLRPLVEAAKAKSPQNVEDVKNVFSVIEHLVPLNQNLMVSMEERILNWSSTQRIGDIFLKFAPFLKMYTTYSNNYDNALQVLTKLSHEAFFTELGISHRQIENIIITPIQRIPRYSLLLSDLLSNTSPDHVDQPDIAKSLAVIKDVADHVNKGVGIYKNVARLTDAGLAHLLAPHRTLVKDGTITVVKSSGNSLGDGVVYSSPSSTSSSISLSLGDKKGTLRNTEVKKHQWHFLLFSDVLVFISQALDENLMPKKKEKKVGGFLKLMDSKPKERTETIFPLYLVWLQDPGLRAGFDLIGPHETMHLYFQTAEERDDWWVVVSAQVKLCLEKTEQPLGSTYRKGRHEFTAVDWYDGEWDNGRIQGKGRMTCPGAVYDGTFDGSYETGSGTITYPSGMKFTGEWKNGRPHCAQATMEYLASGDTYKGEFKDGKRSGKGVLTYKDGSVYDGEWRNDQPHGTGTLTLVASGLVYTGPFYEGKFFGAGTLILTAPSANGVANGTSSSHQKGVANGQAAWIAKYEGAFKDNQRNGRGKMFYEDGSVYEGEWKEDMVHGSGKWQSTDGSTYEGEFKTSLKEGRGLMKWASGDEYIGQWSAGRPHGNGTFTYKTGMLIAKYDGDISHGKRHGKGSAVYISGAKYEGEWAEDLPQGTGKMVQANGVIIEGKWLAGAPDLLRCVVSNTASSAGTSSSASTTYTPASSSTFSTGTLKGLDIPHQFPHVSEVACLPNFDTTSLVFFKHSH